MLTAKSYIQSLFFTLRCKLSDYSLLVKTRLSVTVVFSAVIAFVIASGNSFQWINLALLFLGGFFVTASSNALNEVFEKEYDKLMKRTADRPLAAGRMSVPEAVLAAGIMAVLGIIILWTFNPVSALLGALSLVLYSFVYTPMKRISPIAVFIGAIPGALPPVIGWSCASNGIIGIEAFVLFSIQFLWQFPHFWAIGWIGYDDYQKAGFKLLPSEHGRDKVTALNCVIYTIILLPVSLATVYFGMAGLWTAVFLVLAAIMYFMAALKLYKTCDDADARKLMFASIIYLPVVLTVLLIGNIF